MPLPVVTNDPTKSVIAQKSYLTVTPPGVGAVAVSLLLSDVTYDQSPSFVERKVVGADGVIRPDRKVLTEQSESFKAVLEDVKRAITLFGDTIAGVVLDATAELWVKDPADEAGKAAFHVAAFKCTVTVDGGTSLKATEFSKLTVKIDALEKTKWAADFAIPV